MNVDNKPFSLDVILKRRSPLMNATCSIVSATVLLLGLGGMLPVKRIAAWLVDHSGDFAMGGALLLAMAIMVQILRRHEALWEPLLVLGFMLFVCAFWYSAVTGADGYEPAVSLTTAILSVGGGVMLSVCVTRHFIRYNAQSLFSAMIYLTMSVGMIFAGMATSNVKAATIEKRKVMAIKRYMAESSRRDKWSRVVTVEGQEHQCWRRLGGG